MTRRCSHCGYNGHNSRTCPEDRGVKLFGVRLTSAAVKKSVSMGNLLHYPCSYNNIHSALTPEQSESGGAATDGYVSDGLVHISSSIRGRKKGVPWTEQEHRLFLVGLQKLGKGDWRGISRNFVPTRTPTQVASHAQKYFLRQSNLNKRKRRSSLFDIPADVLCSMDAGELMPKYSDFISLPNDEQLLGPSIAASSSLTSPPLAATFSVSNAHLLGDIPPLSLGSKPISDAKTNLGAALRFALPLWPGLVCEDSVSPSSPKATTEMIKPTSALYKVDELALSIGPPSKEHASPISLKLNLSPGNSGFITANTSTPMSSSNGSINSAISVV